MSLFVSKISPQSLRDRLDADVFREKKFKFDLSEVIDAAKNLAERLDEDRIPHNKPNSRERSSGGDSSEPGDGSSFHDKKEKKRKDHRTDDEILHEGRFQPFKPDMHRASNQKNRHQCQPLHLPPCLHKAFKKTYAKKYASECPN